jgi:hypothetical protein
VLPRKVCANIFGAFRNRKSGLWTNAAGMWRSFIQRAKKSWKTKVEGMDGEAILDASRRNFDAWWYFNHVRLFDLARGLRINLRALSSYPAALSAKLIDQEGLLKPRAKTNLHMYDGGEGMLLYDYVREVMEKVLAHLTILNVSDYLDRGVLIPVLKAGDFVFVQGAHVFASSGDRHQGRGQRYTGTRRANHVEVTFIFDRWEATSISAWGLLSGRREAASVLRIVSVRRAKGKVVLECTVIGISAAAGLKQREYASLPYHPGVVVIDEREDEVEDFVADPSEDGLDEPF